MDLPLFSAVFIVFALSLYVLLDGFDLGVGVLLLTQTDKGRRDQMVDSILPTWDGNETWLIMAGVGLLAAFPIAYGILLPALYLPVVVMLLALGLRGVSFEFRYQVQRGRRDWDLVFGLGSIIAILMQGIILGGLIQGVTLVGEGFGGNVFDVFRPFAMLVAATLLSGYVVLGAAWLHLKGTDSLRDFAEARLRRGVPLFMLLSALTCVAADHVQSGVRAAWTNHGTALALICTLFLAILATLLRCIGRTSDGVPFALVIIAFALGISGLGLAVYPDVVPFRLTLWAAAAGTSSHVFLLIGASLVTPIVLAYSAFAYRVFRGKIPALGWEQ